MISPAVADLVALLLRAYARQGFAVDLAATGIDPLREPDDEAVSAYHELCAS